MRRETATVRDDAAVINSAKDNMQEKSDHTVSRAHAKEPQS